MGQPPSPGRLALPAHAHQEAGRPAGPVRQVSHLLYQNFPGQLFAAPEDGDAHREGS